MNSFEELWENVTQVLETEMSEVIYNVWLKDIMPVGFEDGVVTLALGEFKRKIVETKFLATIKDAFEQVLGFAVDVRLVEPSENATGASRPNARHDDDGSHNTFDTFVVGSSNKFAHAAALAVAANPGKAYNPLFIYGRSGLGKTHLLSAIASEIKSNNPEVNIILTYGEAFTNELIYCIAQKTMAEFHNKYRSADVLLMDDVQFIATKERTQEEFFHTFKTLEEAGKQIVLTSDRPPKELLTLEERLLTRFESGLIADIQQPDFETRVAIIQQKCAMLDLELSDEVVQYIAEKLKSNIRQLEGAVKKIQALVAIHGSAPNMMTVQIAIKDILSEERPESVTVDRIVEEVARTYGAKPADIRSKKRDAQLSKMRRIAMYIVSEMLEMSTTDIGTQFSGRDHSTVVYNLQEMKRIMAKDSSLRTTVNEIIKNVQESD